MIKLQILQVYLKTTRKILRFYNNISVLFKDTFKNSNIVKNIIIIFFDF